MPAWYHRGRRDRWDKADWLDFILGVLMCVAMAWIGYLIVVTN